MSRNFTNFAFTDSVRQAQERYGTRRSYARMETAGDHYLLTDREAAFIQSRDSFYMATVGENGWPYVHFRGGPNGFLKVIDDKTLSTRTFGAMDSTSAQATSRRATRLRSYSWTTRPGND
jgi:hypothetical protein